MSVIKLDVTPVPTSPGGIVQWLINISNPGGVILDPVFVTDTLPEGFEYVSASPAPDAVSGDGRQVNWTNVGPIGAGNHVLVLLNSSVSETVANGTYSNTVGVTGTPPNGDDAEDYDVASVGIFAPAINIVKSSSAPSAEPGENVTFTLDLSNTGAVNISVTVADILPYGLNFQGADVAPTSVSGGVITWVAIADLPPGASLQINYNVSANASGMFWNNATATGVPPNGANVTDSDSVSLAISEPADDDERDWPLHVDWARLCPGDVILVNVTHRGEPVEGVEVRFVLHAPYQGLLGTESTDSEGIAEFTAPANGTYHFAFTRPHYYYLNPLEVPFLACPPEAPGCLSDSDCPASEACEGGECAPVECACGQVRDHACMAFECCSDDGCGGSEYCSGNECVPVEGQCGYAANHTWQPYECCSDGDCPAGYACTGNACAALPPSECLLDSDCDAGERCREGECVQASYEIGAPDSITLGQNATVLVTRDGEPAQGLGVAVVAPDGSVGRYVTDGGGAIPLYGGMGGTYRVRLEPPGLGEAAVEVVLPPAAADYWQFCWVPLALLALLVLWLYLRGRYTIYFQQGAVGAGTIAFAPGLLDELGLKPNEKVSLEFKGKKAYAVAAVAPKELLKKGSSARGQGRFALVGEGILKALDIRLDKKRDTKGLGFEKFSRISGLRIIRM